jgi:uncharacterized damage-inducible protein DinB
MKCPICGQLVMREVEDTPSSEHRAEAMKGWRVLRRYLWHMLVYAAGGYLLGRFLQ